MNINENLYIERLEIMGDMIDEVRSDEQLADLAARQGEEVELLSDLEIAQLLSDEVVPQNDEYTLEDAQRDFCIEPYEEFDSSDSAYEEWN
jgi:hypothetical protein